MCAYVCVCLNRCLKKREDIIIIIAGKCRLGGEEGGREGEREGRRKGKEGGRTELKRGRQNGAKKREAERS